MNGVLMQLAENRQRLLDEKMEGQILSIDLIVPAEQLFIKSLAELRELDLAMLNQVVNEGWALRAAGAVYEFSFHDQRNLITELLAFRQTHPNFSELSDGRRIFDWIKANGSDMTRFGLHAAWIALRALDEIAPPEPPTITSQPLSVVYVIEGDPAVFEVSATGTDLSYQWFRDDKPLLDATKSVYRFPNTDWFNDRAKFHCVICNSVGAIQSNPATLRVVRK